MPDPVLLTHEYFEPFVDQSFVVMLDEGTLSLRVTEIRMLPPPKRRTLTGRTVDVATTRLPFSVYFRSEGELGLRQGTYRMTPPDAGPPIDTFLVPLGLEEGGVIYEALFN